MAEVKAAPAGTGEGFYTVGLLAMIIGLVAVGFGVQMKTSLGGGLGSSDVVNLALLQRQTIIVHCGLGLLIVGALFMATASILKAILSR